MTCNGIKIDLNVLRKSNNDLYLHRVNNICISKILKKGCKSNFIIKDLKDMVFSEYINSLPNVKVEEINKIAELTCSTVTSVYRWISGDAEPPMVKKKIIAEYLGKSVDELFPEK